MAVPMPTFGPEGLTFPRQNVGVLDGVVDIYRWMRAVHHTPWSLKALSAAGISLSDRLSLRIAAAFLAKRLFANVQKGVLLGAFNHSLRRIITDRWDFNGVGDLAAPGPEGDDNQRR